MKKIGGLKKEYLVQFCVNTFEHLHEVEFFWKNVIEIGAS